MIRRRILKILGVLTLGLFVPKAAKGAKTNGQVALSIPEDDAVFIYIRHQGKTFNLGFQLTDDPEVNARRWRDLTRSHEKALWALGVIKSDLELLALAVFPGRPELSHQEKLALYREHLLQQMHGGTIPVKPGEVDLILL